MLPKSQNELRQKRTRGTLNRDFADTTKPSRGVHDQAALSQVKALVFDTFGTVVDWRSSLIGELSAFGRERGISADWPLLVDEWRAAYYPSMDRVRKGEQPWTTLDALHRQSLERLVASFGVKNLSPKDLDQLTGAWHRLHVWPDAATRPSPTTARARMTVCPRRVVSLPNTLGHLAASRRTSQSQSALFVWRDCR
jgi:hypothetical protein